jgi:transcription antitermination factor NusG
MDSRKENKVWFAMRATYCRELEVKRFLDDRKIENFIPMQYKIVVKNRKKKRELVPIIHNLIFVHATCAAIWEVKFILPYLQFMTEKKGGIKTSIIVPEEQMNRFIAVSGTYDEHLLYFKPEEVNLAKGTKVRIHGGNFDGQEGIFVKVKGARDRRLVIYLEGVIAVATAIIHPDLIEVIEEDKSKGK